MADDGHSITVAHAQRAPATYPTSCIAADVQPENSPPSHSGRGRFLNIPDRPQEQQRPLEGWCGEAAIQMALLYQGAYVPQELINKAGAPVHPDLYSNDIPVALNNLGISQRWWPSKSNDEGRFLQWVSDQIRDGRPVLMGMKVNPSKHPEWSLDHFVLVTGVDEDTLVINTTWGHQTSRTFAQLTSTDPGLGLSNPFDAYYGVSLGGIRSKDDPSGSRAHLFPLRESADELGVVVQCDNLVPGASYAYVESNSPTDAGERICQFTAESSSFGIVVDLPKNAFAVYQCILAGNTLE